MASVVGRTYGSRHRAFRKGIAFESPAQGSSHFGDRGWSLLCPPPGQSGSDAPAFAARTSQLGPVPSLSCLMLCAFGADARCAGDCREAQVDHAGPDPKCGTMADPRGSRILSGGVTLSSRRNGLTSERDDTPGDNKCCGARARSWHEPTIRCSAPNLRLLKGKLSYSVRARLDSGCDGFRTPATVRVCADRFVSPPSETHVG